MAISLIPQLWNLNGKKSELPGFSEAYSDFSFADEQSKKEALIKSAYLWMPCIIDLLEVSESIAHKLPESSGIMKQM